jgi:hypothetical protein
VVYTPILTRPLADSLRQQIVQPLAMSTTSNNNTVSATPGRVSVKRLEL